MNEEFFTTGQAADLLGVNAQTVARWIDSGVMKGHRLHPRGRRRVPAAEVRRLQRQWKHVNQRRSSRASRSSRVAA